MFRRRSAEKPFKPEWMIVGLGNPGPGYRGTRHNVGFDVLDRIATRNRITFQREKRALVGRGRIGDTPVVLVKPTTYMNLSGQAVGPLARANALPPGKILVVADDLDTPFAAVKMKLKGSAGGHNGHKSLIEYLQSQDYPRIKIGIGKVGRFETVGHVLGGFSPEERAEIDSAVAAAAEAAELSVTVKVEAGLDAIARFKALKDRASDPQAGIDSERDTP